MKIVVTGSASTFAYALLPLLAADERIEQIVGADRRESAFDDARFTQVLVDPRSPQVAVVMTDMDAVVHLAAETVFDGAEESGADAAREINRAGTQNVFRCAAEKNVPCVVYLSSAAVYELPARHRPITEQHPRAALPGLAWAEDQVALEAWLDTFEREHPELRVVRLRPHLMVGVHGSALVRRLLRAPFSVRYAGRAPRLQCVHALDVARAVQQALFRNVAGAFNLACANSATLREMQRLNRAGLVPLSFSFAYRLARWTGRLHKGVAPSWMESLRHEVILDTNRARRRLGWKPQYDSVQACLRAAD